MRTAVVVLVLAACGDGQRLCPVDPPATPSGPLSDPEALTLPDDCVDGGLVSLPGRWFVVDPTALFRFEYPKFDGDCGSGFRRVNYLQPDSDLTDGQTFHSWSDGTRYYNRRYARYQLEDGTIYEQATAFATCVRPDDTLGAVIATFDTDRGKGQFPMRGTRFEPKDGEPVGLALVGSLGTQSGGNRLEGALQVAVEGTHAYIAGLDGFDIIDITNPAAPLPTAHMAGSFNDVKVVVAGGSTVAYVSPRAGADDTLVIDVTRPTAPSIAARIKEFSHSVQTQVRGATTLLYLATYTTEVPVYDITDPLSPERIGAAPVPGTADVGIHDLFADGDVIYANKTTDGVVAIDTAAGLSAAVELGRIKTSYSHASVAGVAGGRKIVLHGDEGMSPDGGAFLRILDGDRASPTYMHELARYQSRPEVGIHNFQLVGDKVYIAYYHDGIRIVDLSTPTAPREVAHYNTWDPETASGGTFEAALGIRVTNNLIYVADLARGLLILREI